MNYNEFIAPVKDFLNQKHAQTWADLGCGSGVFTYALASYLPNGSKIYAIDKTNQQLPNLMGDGIAINFLKADFNQTNFNFKDLDGILMANSLHYVQDKKALISKLQLNLSTEKTMLFIEYDTQISNQWVPYPISYTQLKQLFLQMNYSEKNIIKLAERRSVYNQGNMYAALVSSKNLHS